MDAAWHAVLAVWQKYCPACTMYVRTSMDVCEAHGAFTAPHMRPGAGTHKHRRPLHCAYKEKSVSAARNAASPNVQTAVDAFTG
jgi:hypothetical protein